MLKLKLGPPPDNELVRHDISWKAVSGYDTTPAGALRMLGVGFMCTLVTLGLWSALVPGALSLGWPSILLTLAVVVALVVLHEAIHLLAFPGGGVGNAVVGFWPAKGAAYIEYTLPVSRRRFVLVALAPVLFLSVGVLAVAAIGVRVPAPVQWASVLNAFGSGGDLLVVCLVLRQSSPSALVLGSGQQLYTRVSSPGESHP